MKRRPILLTVRALNLGGCERDLTKVALGLSKDNFEPHVGCFYDDGFRADELRAAKIPIVCFPVRSLRAPSTVGCALRLARYLKHHRIQLVHAFDAPTTVFVLPIAKLSGVRAIVSSNLWFRQMMPPGFFLRALRLTDRLADRVVVNSKATERHLLEDEHMRPGLPYLSYNGVDPQAFHPGERDLAHGGPIVIGTVCALRAEKRVDLMLEAFAKLRATRPGITLQIVGSGEMLPELEAQSARLGLGQSCVFIPAQQDVAPWMRGMDIFVLASSTESFPNSVLEAMACGCCVVASNVGGVPEVVHDQKTGLLFKTCEADDLVRALLRVVDDGDLRARLASEASKLVIRDFSIQSAVQRMEGLYANLLGIR